jgi:hypothetical protein
MKSLMSRRKERTGVWAAALQYSTQSEALVSTLSIEIK